jgi:hypothetical protein
MATTQQRVVAQLHLAAEDAHRIADTHHHAARPPEVEAEREALRLEFEPHGWSIVFSSASRWWAFRPLSATLVDEVSDIDANTPQELRIHLRALSGGQEHAPPPRHARREEPAEARR